MKHIFSTAFTFIICGVSVFFFYQSKFLVGVVLLNWTIYRIINLRVKQSEIEIDMKRNTNIALEFQIDIENLLINSSIDDLLNKLNEENIVREKDKKKWLQTLLDNYKKYYKTSKHIETVKFNIKNNLVWVNDEIHYFDSLEHEIYIPYEYEDGDADGVNQYNSDNSLTIKLYISYGFLRLVCDWNSFHAGYNYEIMTSFPLFYFSYQHKIPIEYLGFPTSVMGSKAIGEYNYVCNLARKHKKCKGKWHKIVKAYNLKKKIYLKKAGFKDYEEFYDTYNVDTDGFHYLNKYLDIKVRNYNDYHNENRYKNYERVKVNEENLSDQQKKAREYFKNGSNCYTLGKYEKAIKDSTKAIELDSRLAKAYDTRASAYYNLGQKYKAVDDYSMALKLDPTENILIYMARGIAYYDLGQYGKVIEDYTKIIELVPQWTEAYNLRGQAYENLGQHDKARRDFDKVNELR